MSDGSKTSEQLRSTTTRRKPRNQPHEPYDAFFRGDFCRLFDYIERFIKGEPTQQYERDALTNAIRWVTASVVKHAAFQALVMALAIAAIGYALYAFDIAVDANGKLDANWVIALLTLAVVFTAILQWSVIRTQTDEFAKQNEIMIEQNETLRDEVELARRQLEQAEKAGGHTESMIEQMRLEMRPWVATSVTTHGPLPSEYADSTEPDLPIVVRNEGKSPAFITHSLVDLQMNFEPNLENFERTARARPAHRTVLGPQDTVVFRARDIDGKPPTLMKSQANLIEAGQLPAYLIGVFIYQDAQGNEHKTTCSYKYGNNGQSFLGRPDDGDMT